MKYILIILFSVFAVSAHAAPLATGSENFAIQCDALQGVKTEHFKTLNQEALKVNRALCHSLQDLTPQVTEEDQLRLLSQFADAAKSAAARVAEVLPIENLNRPFDNLKQTLARRGVFPKQLPGFNFERFQGVFYFADYGKHASFRPSDNSRCVSRFAETCDKVFAEYETVFDQYKSAYAKLSANATVIHLRRLSAQWDDYLAHARSQTTLDLLLTTAMESRHFKQGRLVGPPVRQWSVLHPDLVYEHFSAAQGSSENKLGVAIEWIGVNWWNKDTSPLGIPFGVSLATTYGDWGNSSHAGHGVVFHFYNRYSIGWSRRDGENGVYVSVDLLNALVNKKNEFEEYKSKMGTFQNPHAP